jgi:hypothetical protein
MRVPLVRNLRTVGTRVSIDRAPRRQKYPNCLVREALCRELPVPASLGGGLERDLSPRSAPALPPRAPRSLYVPVIDRGSGLIGHGSGLIGRGSELIDGRDLLGGHDLIGRSHLV